MSKPLAKRRLRDISFEHEGAALALVSKDQGGPANGRDVALVMKATSNFSEDFLEKAQKVRVTMELPDFLTKFFDLWCEDAEILARMMGYEPVEKEVTADYQDYIQEKVDSFEILKSAYESESLAQILCNLDEGSYMTMLRDQEILEKAFDKVDSVKGEQSSLEQPVATETTKARIVVESGEATKTEEVEKASEIESQAKTAVQADTQTEGKEMTGKSVKVEKTETVEMIDKSQFELINKANEELKAELAKSAALVAEFQKERKEAIDKARKSVLGEAVEDQEKVEQLFKAVGELEDEAFTTVVEVMKSLRIEDESNEMFQEKGTTGESDEGAVSALRKSLEQKYNQKGDK